MIALSMVIVRMRSLSATMRPSRSKMRPRSGVSFTVRVRTSCTRSCRPRASTAWRNHSLTVSSDPSTMDTVASTARRETFRSRGISASPSAR